MTYFLFKDGGFFSAEDADSLPSATSLEKKEGAFCVWEFQELQQLLAEKVTGTSTISQFDVFCHYYGVKEAGNVDPMQVLDNITICMKISLRKQLNNFNHFFPFHL